MGNPYFDWVLGEWRDGGGDAGAGGGLVEVVSGGSVGYIPVLSGGTCYRFTDPLTVLSIGAVASSLQESDILFVAGAVVSPPPEIKVKYQTGATWEYDDEAGGDIEFPVYSAFTLTSSGAGYGYTVPSNLPWYEWGHGDDPEVNNGSGWLSGGSFTCASSSGKWVISAHGVTEFMHRLEYDDDITTSRILDTWLASSTDGMTTWTVNTAQGARLYAQWFDDLMTWDTADVDASPEIDAAPVPTPCDVILPSGTLLVNSSAITVESGHRYEMNLKYGAIVTGEVMEASNE